MSWSDILNLIHSGEWDSKFWLKTNYSLILRKIKCQAKNEGIHWMGSQRYSNWTEKQKSWNFLIRLKSRLCLLFRKRWITINVVKDNNLKYNMLFLSIFYIIHRLSYSQYPFVILWQFTAFLYLIMLCNISLLWIQ